MKVDYQKTIIYKLCCLDVNITDIYVGSTTNFKLRNYDHRNCCNNPNNKDYNNYKYKFIREHGGYENWRMIQIKEFPCNSKREAEAEETRIMIELKSTLNSKRAFQTKEERKEYCKKYDKEYYENNKEHITEYQKDYSKEYYENNKEHLKKYKKEYGKQKVKCQFCGMEIRKDSLTRHKKTNKCLAIQDAQKQNI